MNNKPKKCGSCRSPMVYTKVEHPYWYDNVLVALVHDVPSWVCELCGQRYFEPAVTSTLEHLVRDYIKLGKTFPIPSTPYRAVAEPALS